MKRKLAKLREEEFAQVGSLISKGFTEGELISKNIRLTWKLTATIDRQYNYDELPDNGVGG